MEPEDVLRQAQELDKEPGEEPRSRKFWWLFVGLFLVFIIIFYLVPYQWSLTRSLDSGNYTGLVELINPSRGDYNLCFFMNDTQGCRSPVVKTQIGLNNLGVAPNDTVTPEVWIKTLVKAPYKKVIIEFHLSCLGPKNITHKKVDKAIELIRKYIKEEGGMCYTEDEL